MSKELEKKWLVFYTRSRAEKKTRDLLIRMGYDCFLPLQKVIRQWSDRKKKVEIPLFNSYIFVHEHESKIMDILQLPGMVYNVRQNGIPAVIRQKEIDMIRRFLETGYFLESLPSEHLKRGDKVEIIDGPLRGMKGVLVHEHNEDKFAVIVEAIDRVITINIDKQYLKFISETDSASESYWNDL